MDVLDTIVNAAAIGLVGLVLGLQTRSFRSEMKQEIAELRRETHREFGFVRGETAELRREMHEEFRSVRSDLTGVALAVGAAINPAAGAPGASG